MVVSRGLASGLWQLVQLNPVDGVQVNPVPPTALSVVEFPYWIVTFGLAFTIAVFTITFTMTTLSQPPAVETVSGYDPEVLTVAPEGNV